MTIPCIGLHNVLNALAAFCVGVQAGLDRERVAEALRWYQPAGMRQRIVSCRNVTVIEDCYNASPDSMTAALSILVRLPCRGKRIAVLGDMLELGDLSCEAHKNLGRQVAERKVDLLLCFGEQSRLTVEEAKACKMQESYHFDSKEALCDCLLSRIRPGDLLLCKGSRSMAMEQVLQQLYSRWEG